jgi:hypothetical protein
MSTQTIPRLACAGCGTVLGGAEMTFRDRQEHMDAGCRKVVTTGPGLTVERRFHVDVYDRHSVDTWAKLACSGCGHRFENVIVSQQDWDFHKADCPAVTR